MKRLSAIGVVVGLVGVGAGAVLGVSEPATPATRWAPVAGEHASGPVGLRASTDCAEPVGAEVPFPSLRGAASGASLAPLTAEETAPRLASILRDVDQTSELMGLTRVMADDPEMSTLLQAEAEGWRTSGDPALRARGLLILVGLRRLDAAAWQNAVATEPQSEARALMVASPPLGGVEDALIVDALIDRLRFDDSGAVRLAALDAMPVLDASGAEHVVTALRGDRDPGVRRLAAVWLRGAESEGPAVGTGLLAAAVEDQDPAVRRAAAVALIRLEERHPGALAATGGTKEDLADVLATTGDDRS